MKSSTDKSSSSMDEQDIKEHKSGMKKINDRANFMFKLSEKKKTSYTKI
jgi:hypothetical protein